jgi:Fe2+ transport system protein FeoA
MSLLRRMVKNVYRYWQIRKMAKCAHGHWHKHWIKAHFQKFKRFDGRMAKHTYEHWRKRWIKAHFQKFKAFDNCLKINSMTKLSNAVPGSYRFIAASCDEKLRHRLLELGFLPGEELIVIENTGRRGSIMVKIKGSRIALSDKVADNILLKRK